MSEDKVCSEEAKLNKKEAKLNKRKKKKFSELPTHQEHACEPYYCIVDIFLHFFSLLKYAQVIQNWVAKYPQIMQKKEL